MSRSHTVLLEALMALVATIGVQPQPEPVGAHLASPGALACEWRRDVADDVVRPHTRRDGPARGEPAGVGVPGPTSVVAADVAVVQSGRRAELVQRNRGALDRVVARPMCRFDHAVEARTAPRGRDHDGRDRCAIECGARGKIVSDAVGVELRARGGDRYPPWGGSRLRSARRRAACLRSLRQVGGGVPFRPPSTPRGRRTRIEIACERGVETTPQPTKATAPDALRGGLARGLGLGSACHGGDTRPHWRGRPAGLASKAPVSGDRSGTSRGHPGDVARTVRFPDKWDNALLAIAKGLMP